MSTVNDIEKGRATHHDDNATTTSLMTHDKDGNLAPSAFRLAPAPHKPFRQFGNPAPLGLSAFALTTFVLSLVNVQARGVTTPNLVVGLAYGYGGLVQLLAGMWEFATGNTFGATALSSYGGFWISWAIIQTPSFAIIQSYDTPGELDNVLGFYLLGWFIFTFMMFLCTLRATLAFVILFGTLDLAFLFLSIGHLALSENCTKAGGYFGLLSAFTAWYCALAGILNTENSFFTLPVIHFPWSGAGNPKRD